LGDGFVEYTQVGPGGQPPHQLVNAGKKHPITRTLWTSSLHSRPLAELSSRPFGRHFRQQVGSRIAGQSREGDDGSRTAHENTGYRH
jgi:hypothetical protein